MSDTVPAVIGGRYAIIQSSKMDGGLSSVYKATDLLNDGAVVAVKLLTQTGAKSDLVSLAFRREVASLRALDHPNIVRMIDAGDDDDSALHYIVLEWLPKRLEDLVAPIRSDGGWDDFANLVGLPLLRALSFAHERGVVHRDVKPSNVLVTARNVPKLVDFGISKLKTTLDPDPRTLAGFGSGPYAPLDRESAASPNRDVYGFAVLALHCLTELQIKDHTDVGRALEEGLDAPPRIADLLKRCVSNSGRDRPSSATVLLYELEPIQAERDREWTIHPRIHVGLTVTASANIEGAGISLADADAKDRFLSEQFGGGCYGLPTEDGKLRLIGNHWIFICADDNPPVLTVIAANQPAGHSLDRLRSVGAPMDFEFTTKVAADYAAAEDNLKQLRWRIEENERLRQEERVESERYRLFDQWERQLRAREAFEQRREPPLPFDHVDVGGQRAVFSLLEAPASDLTGQRRVIDREGGRGPRVSGEVDYVRDRELVLHLDRPVRGDVSHRGRLVLDTMASHIAFDRQLRALSALRLGAADVARNDVGELILAPSKNRPAVPYAPETWANELLDVEKRSAISSALGAPDFFMVKGPPGTGKTAFIAELISQEVRRDPRARVLVASQTHVALDNAILKVIEGDPSLRVVRLGRLGDEFLPEVRPLMLDSRREQWAAEVRETCEAFIRGYAVKSGADVDNLRSAVLLGQVMAAREEGASAGAQYASIDEQLRRSDGPDGDADAVLSADERDAFQAQRSDLRESGRLTQKRVRELTEAAAARLQVTPEEIEDFSTEELRQLATDCFPADTTDRTRLRDLVVLQGEWLDNVGHGQDFEEALLASASVIGATCVGFAGVKAASRLSFDVCIVDEASKATATEVLVPAVKAGRWVLVGDQRQLPPFQDEAMRDDEIIAEFELDRDELKQTLFDRLVENVESGLVAFLHTQHRMTGAIGELVSSCFYDGEIVSAEDAPEALPQTVLSKPITWITTERDVARRERPAGTSGLSYANALEATAILRVLRTLNDRIAYRAEHSKDTGDGSRLSVLVLAGYLAQVGEIQRKLQPFRASMPSLQIEVNTVDASQGREAQLVVLSVVRSNSAGRLGFMEQSTRINVAMSRAQLGLVIVGDGEFCRAGGGPLATVVDYIRRHPEDAAIEELAKWPW